MNSKLLFLIAFAFVAAGCANTRMQPVHMSDDVRAEFAAADSIAVSMHVTPGFMFMTPANALVGAGMASFKDSSTAPSWTLYTQKHGVPDFTDTVRSKLLASLANDITAVQIETLDERQPYSSDEETAYVAAIPADYVLEVRTMFGSLGYKPLAWKTYVMGYSGMARIIRSSDQTVVWKGTCVVKNSEDPVLEFPGADFIEGNGEMLRQAAAYVTDSCAQQLYSTFRQG